MVPAKVYVSVTGLRIRRPWHAPRFWWHAIRSMVQARQAPGNLRAETRTIEGVHHTLSVWTSDVEMRAFLVAGNHRKAMAAFRAIGSGRTHGFWWEGPIDWQTALRRWRIDGRDV